MAMRAVCDTWTRAMKLMFKSVVAQSGTSVPGPPRATIVPPGSLRTVRTVLQKPLLGAQQHDAHRQATAHVAAPLDAPHTTRPKKKAGKRQRSPTPNVLSTQHAEVLVELGERPARPLEQEEGPPGLGGPQWRSTVEEFESKLRFYQRDAVAEVLREWQQGRSRLLVAMATGAGKTFTFCFLALLLRRRTLVLVHRKELVEQTERTLLTNLPHLHGQVGILHGRRKEMDKHIVVATIQSAMQVKSLDRLEQLGFDLLVVDEAHHATADSYLVVMERLGFLPSDHVQMVKDESKRTQLGASPQPAVTTEAVTSPRAWSSDSDASPNKEEAAGNSVSGDSTDLSAAHRPLTPGDDEAASPAASGPGGWTLQGNVVDVEAQVVGGVHLTTQAEARAFADETFRVGPERKLLLGVTATPYRSDDKDALACVFESMAFQIEIAALVRAGHLCKVRARRVLTSTDISSVATSGQHRAVDEDGTADFVASELSKVVNSPERNALVVQAYKQLADGRKAIAFACDISHAEALAQAFRECGVAAECISSLSGPRRDELLHLHKAGHIKVLTNCGILTEGYDDPSVSCVLMTRPTKSTGLFTQCVGRGLRVHPEKEDCLILDFTDRSHRLDRASDLITCDMLFKQGEGVTMEGYEPPKPYERVQPEIQNILMKGGVMTLYEGTTYSWTSLAGALWLQLRGISSPPTTFKDKNGKVIYPRPRNSSSSSTNSKSLDNGVGTDRNNENKAPTLWVQLRQLGPPTKEKRSKRLKVECQLKISSSAQMPPEDGQWDVKITLKHMLSASEAEEEQQERQQGGSQDGTTSYLRHQLPPEPVIVQVEAILQRLAKKRAHGLTPAMLALLSKGADWRHHHATVSQLALLKRRNEHWQLFKAAEDIPHGLSKGQACELIAMGILYQAYCSANNLSTFAVALPEHMN